MDAGNDKEAMSNMEPVSAAAWRQREYILFLYMVDHKPTMEIARLLDLKPVDVVRIIRGMKDNGD